MNTSEIKNWHKETIGQKVVDALIKNDFDALYVSTMEEASDFVMKHVTAESKVGFPGSMTIYNMGIQDKARALGAEVLDHSVDGLTLEEKGEIAKKEMLSDLYLCSTNAVTLDGMLVNVDAWGNRIAAMNFGPKKVIIVVSVDKVCKDEAAAFERLKNTAAPMNNMRLNTQNPCTKTGTCVNCQVKNRICRTYSVMKKKPGLTDITVVVVGDHLGF
ncbi:lactate utilization protein [Clostridium chromiireducens]|uniref:Lactate utilization protein n=1 Tax=Clostridium chromiireducens TaxID=225345 RepID=A0A964W3U2_9CLOT|nr:lactate utilization protein [Clostridium chromiireducens]MVX65483.1 lactate utilization protein [Clostridium chromiireducens]